MLKYIFLMAISLFVNQVYADESYDESALNSDFRYETDDEDSDGTCVAYDPFERINRTTFEFNQKVDTYLIRPTAQFYGSYTPSFIKNRVNDFFGNMEDVVSFGNAVLQGKFKKSVNIAGRIVFNSTFGVFGLFDWATKNGMIKHKEDFGQTLYVWGIQNGPYIVWPLLGSSTLRDSTGLVFDALTINPIYNESFLSPVYDHGNVSARNVASASNLVRVREKMLNASDIADTAALDPYDFYRFAYCQHRMNENNK